MTIFIDWRYLDGALFTDLSRYARKYELELTSEAMEGGTAASRLILYDSDAELDIIGWSHFRVWEMDAPEGQRCIHQGHASRERVRRGEYDRVTVQRVWEIELSDINAILNRRLFDLSEANRPAETDIARIAWLQGTAALALIPDDTYVDTTGAVPMDAQDYRTQTSFQVIDDCAQQSGKNWFAWYKEDDDVYSLWYARGDSEEYESDIALTNVLSEVDEDTFLISLDTELDRDPSRVYAQVAVPYDGGTVFAKSAETLIDYPTRGFVAPSVNVKSAAKANARARRYLNDLDTEEDQIETTIHKVPLADVNRLMQGMRVQIKATHLPGYETAVWMRCVARTVRHVSAEFYSIQATLIAPKPAPPVLPVYGILYRTQGPDDDYVVHFDFPGDTPGAGYLHKPTAGLIEVLVDGTPEHPNYPNIGYKITGTGTVDVTFFATFTGVMAASIATSYTVTWAILLNGTPVASESQVFTLAMGEGFRAQTGDQLVTVSALAVEPDDEITAFMSCTPVQMAFFRTPKGAGQNGDRLEITGGSLV